MPFITVIVIVNCYVLLCGCHEKNGFLYLSRETISLLLLMIVYLCMLKAFTSKAIVDVPYVLHPRWVFTGRVIDQTYPL